MRRSKAIDCIPIPSRDWKWVVLRMSSGAPILPNHLSGPDSFTLTEQILPSSLVCQPWDAHTSFNRA